MKPKNNKPILGSGIPLHIYNRPIIGDTAPGHEYYDDSEQERMSMTGVTTFNGRSGEVTLEVSDIPDLSDKYQATLVSGRNIKTLAGNSLLGEGSLDIKTINGSSLIGTGNITIETGLVPTRQLLEGSALKGKTLCFNTAISLSTPITLLINILNSSTKVTIGQIYSSTYNDDVNVYLSLSGVGEVELYNNHDGWKYSYYALTDNSLPEMEVGDITYNGSRTCPFITILGVGVDIAMTAGSHNLITSGAVYTAVTNMLGDQTRFVPKRLHTLTDASGDKETQLVYVDDNGQDRKTSVKTLQEGLIKTVDSVASPTESSSAYVFLEI